MKKEDAIKFLQQLYPYGGHCWLDEQRIEAIGMAIRALQEEPVSEDLEEASMTYAQEVIRQSVEVLREQYKERYGLDFGKAIMYPNLNNEIANHFKKGAQWQKNHILKPADGSELPAIDREVIALTTEGKVVFAHRPPEYWDGKGIATGKVTRRYPKRYGAGGWNWPDIKWWLDIDIPLRGE